MKIAYVWNANRYSGVGLRARKILSQLQKTIDGEWDVFEIDGQKASWSQNGNLVRTLSPWPGVLGSKTVGWWRVGRAMKRKWDNDYAVTHYTNQTLSFLAKPTEPAIVTVHDLIELTDPQSRGGELSAKLLYRGIKEARQIIAVSQYTAEQISNVLNVPTKKITVSYNGVGEEFYRIKSFKETLACHKLRHELKLPDDARVLLYVGSDHRRKNVTGALKVFTELRRHNHDLYFIKVGAPGIREERARLLDRVNRLGVKNSVKFISGVSSERLNELYNLADLLLYPTKFEGFGMPPLEAMSCGTPVITSNVTSLPEVVGDDAEYGERAAAVFAPTDYKGMVEAAQSILGDEVLANRMSVMGQRRAKQFTWETAAEQVAKVYRLTERL